jgi:hypothetical protein
MRFLKNPNRHRYEGETVLDSIDRAGKQVPHERYTNSTER